MAGTRDPFYQHGLTLIQVDLWISNYTNYKVCNEIAHPFPNFNDATVQVFKWVNNFTPDFTWHAIKLYMLGKAPGHGTARNPSFSINRSKMIITSWFFSSIFASASHGTEIFIQRLFVSNILRFSISYHAPNLVMSWLWYSLSHYIDVVIKSTVQSVWKKKLYEFQLKIWQVCRVLHCSNRIWDAW